MPKVTYMHFDGNSVTVDAEPGSSVMQTAIRNGVSGIVAECGGVLSCATCHVYLDPASAEQFAPVSADEDAMLEGTAADREETSRLSCQLLITDATSDVQVSLPEVQD